MERHEMLWSEPVRGCYLVELGETRLHAFTVCRFRRRASEFLAWQQNNEDRPLDLRSLGQIDLSVRFFLIESMKRLILVDTGIGHRAPALDPYAVYEIDAVNLLVGAGLDPDDVSTVIFTHLHADHCGGAVTSEGDPKFENARHVVHAAEVRHWESIDAASAAAPRLVIGQMRAHGLLDAIEDSVDVFSGEIRAVHLPGHTPGHMVVEVSGHDTGLQALLLGDALHHPMQIGVPGFGVLADVDPPLAVASREEALRRLAATGALGVAGHFGAAPFFRVAMDGSRFSPALVDGKAAG